MKFKHLFLTVSVMALFSSCSNEELVSETTTHGDAIAFSVTTSNATRAADYWCNSNLPKFFEVSTAYNNAFYFNNEVYKAEDGNYVQADGNFRYWPDLSADKPLNVYAYKVKADGASAIGDEFAQFAWSAANAAPTITMTPATEAKDQRDLLYAYTQVKTKPAYGATAPINFRHALSQIVFYAKCSNTKIYVEIEEIALMNAATSGTFTLPTGTNVTDVNLDNHTQGGTAETSGLGTWALNYASTKDNRSYTASCLTAENKLTALTPGAGEDAWVNLTDNKPETSFTQSLLVLPQTKYSDENNNNLAKYIPYTGEGASKTYNKLEDVGGACFAIKCKIRNIAGAAVTDDDVYLWGDKDNAKDLVLPVDFIWEQGKKYIYRINFSKKGNAGFDPGTGKEVLVPIQLSVTVDDFAKGITYDGNW